jgi:hypothetical protein
LEQATETLIMVQPICCCSRPDSVADQVRYCAMAETRASFARAGKLKLRQAKTRLLLSATGEKLTFLMDS